MSLCLIEQLCFSAGNQFEGEGSVLDERGTGGEETCGSWKKTERRGKALIYFKFKHIQ